MQFWAAPPPLTVVLVSPKAEGMTDAFYVEEDGRFVATPHTRGPWSPKHQHGGPAAALLGRGIRLAAAEEGLGMDVARIAVDFVKPVPIGPLQLSVESQGGGRSSRRFQAELRADGAVVAQARALLIRTEAVDLPELPKPPPPPKLADDCDLFQFPFFGAEVGYHTSMDVRFARGRLGAGPSFVWLRLKIPLLAGEDPTPLERVLVAADSGNGVSFAIDPKRYLFINPDLSVHLHRMPQGDWVALEAETTAETNGIGLADTRLWDAQGPIGRSAQSLLIAER